jgi:hypothetical protein
MVGAPEAGAVVLRALRSPVQAFRWTALEHAAYLGPALDHVLPALGALLDDPAWREAALEQLMLGLDRQAPPRPLDEDRLDQLVQTYRERLRAAGHLPR